MTRLMFWTTAIVAASLVIAGCTTPALAPTPTKAPAAPAKTAEPAKPAAAQPTAAPAPPTAVPTKAVVFPEKGKVITYLVPWAAGGPIDTAARLLAPAMEKDLGTTVQVLNRAGASGQIGLTEMISSGKSDGYTFGVTGFPTTIMTYLDPQTKAVYGRKDFQPVAMYATSSIDLAVAADSPYKGLKDLVDAAKANPEKVAIGDTGLAGSLHLATLALSQLTGAKFAEVHFAGSAPEAQAAVLGGHIDATVQSDSGVLGQVKGGKMRLLADFGAQRSRFYPDVPTAIEQGFNMTATSDAGISVRAGTPKEIVQRLSKAMKTALTSGDVVQKAGDTFIIRYMDAAEYEAEWDLQEANAKKLLPLIRR